LDGLFVKTANRDWNRQHYWLRFDEESNSLLC